MKREISGYIDEIEFLNDEPAGVTIKLCREKQHPYRCVGEPVYLVDASPESKEVVVPKELLEWVEKTASAIDDHVQHGGTNDWLQLACTRLNKIYPKEQTK